MYVFSGPVATTGVVDTEIEAILHVIEQCNTTKFLNKSVAICSDSNSAMNRFKKDFPATTR